MKPFLDYSQYKAFSHCPWDWWEQYVQATKRAYPEGQREDALALGSLVHDGLANFRKDYGCPLISEEIIAEVGPTPECLAWASTLLLGYRKAYPNEDFIQHYVEQPLRFPVHYAMDGLAKIDSYFHVEQPTQINDGLGGHFWLQPGWWIKEYKTKDASRNTGNWMASWAVNLQAAFQILALQELIQEPVQGVLIDTLEKPTLYVPKRSCKGCKVQSELRDWVPTGAGYACPQCQHVQALDTSDKSKALRVPKYYRFMIFRTDQELAVAREEILMVAREMLSLMMPEPQDADLPLRQLGLPPVPRASERCVDSVWGKCQYFEPHTMFRMAKGWEGFVQVEPFEYVKES